MATAERDDRAERDDGWRIVRGRPEPRELAVLVAVLAALARQAARAPGRGRAGVPGWAVRRPGGHPAARSWRTVGRG
ncbi:hypothetical protein GCM10020229_12230 [Kitasatospora albolonga]|uniref:acyl-CoA carboxylase epsilon subunit n=1 Tax=Kitasatospora albolonga TaxID=68173 RepID=UPI0031E76A1F